MTNFTSFKKQLSNVKNYTYGMTKDEHLREIENAEKEYLQDPTNDCNFVRLVLLKIAFYDYQR